MFLAADGVVFLVLVAFWLYALYDVITTHESHVRNLPKVAWVIIVLLFSEIGAAAWFLLGHPSKATLQYPGGRYREYTTQWIRST